MQAPFSFKMKKYFPLKNFNSFSNVATYLNPKKPFSHVENYYSLSFRGASNVLSSQGTIG